MKKIKTSKFEEKWTVGNAPLIFIEMVYIGDTEKRKKFIGHEFGRHYFIARDQFCTFYMNKESEKKAKSIGEKKYKDISFIKEFIKLTRKIEKRIFKITNEIDKTKLGLENKKGLYQLFRMFFNNYAELVGIYRFTRPDSYEKAVAYIKKRIPTDKKEDLSLLLNNEFDKLDFKIDEKIKELSEQLRAVGKARLQMHHVYLDTWLIADKLFREIAKRMKFTVKEVKNCTFKEIKEFLIKDTIPNKEEIRKRVKYFKFICHDKFYEIRTSPDKADKEMVDFRKIKKLKGQSAFSGKVSGRVRLVTHLLGKSLAEEMKKMKKGDILVSVSTSPDLMPIIKKAGAIVVNQGGLLSHAAIISREFRIPCVVGTKIATKVLKDGDLVEVDANEGVVRKLE